MRTVVIGGGAAGIAAARRLHDAGAEVLLVEAGSRLGGRARSVAVGSVAGNLSLSPQPASQSPAHHSLGLSLSKPGLAIEARPSTGSGLTEGSQGSIAEGTESAHDPASSRDGFGLRTLEPHPPIPLGLSLSKPGLAIEARPSTSSGLTGGDRDRARPGRLGEAPASTRIEPNAAIDLGCGWLHSAGRNPWTAIAERTGAAIDRSSPHWGEQWRDLAYPPDEQRAFRAAYERWDEAAHAALAGPDRPLSDFVAPDDPWRPMIDAISGYANGAPLDRVSLHDWAAYEDAATDDNWALPAGYGTLIVGHAGDVPVRLDTPVTRIDHRGLTIRLDTPAGTIEADRVILAIPTTAYAAIRFDPPLSDKQAAAAALPLGLADKVFLAVDRPEWPAHAHLIGDPHRSCTASHRLSPFGLPIIESFFGGACAEAMADTRAATDFAIGELVALLGSDWRHRLTPLTATHWRGEPHIHGSYSHARVGQAGARAMLAAPVDSRLFFAGEACSATDFSTAHGAYQTGIAAAEAILPLLEPAARR